MLIYFCKRLLAIIPVMLAVTFLLFTLLYFTPGDPAVFALGESATPASIAEFRREYGLDKPFFVRYGHFIYNAVVHQDLGRSYLTHMPVAEQIAKSFPITLKLASGSILIATVLGITFGVICAIKQYSIFDNVAMILAMFGISIPVFYLGILLVIFFSVYLRWLPSSGFSTLGQSIMPCFTLAAASMSIIARMTRSSMLEVINSDYVRTARAKGQREALVIIKHALRNALIPIITIVGIQYGNMLGGAILVESVFSIPGVGRLAVEGLKARDFPMVQGTVMYIALTFVVLNLLVDLLYAWADPRLRSRFR